MLGSFHTLQWKIYKGFLSSDLCSGSRQHNRLSNLSLCLFPPPPPSPLPPLHSHRAFSTGAWQSLDPRRFFWRGWDFFFFFFFFLIGSVASVNFELYFKQQFDEYIVHADICLGWIIFLKKATVVDLCETLEWTGFKIRQKARWHSVLCDAVSDTVRCWSGDCLTVTVSQDALSAPPYLWHSPVLVWWLSDCHCITRCFVSPSLSLTQSSVGLVTVWLSLYHKMLCQPLPISDTVRCWSGDCLTVTVSQDALSAPPYLWHSPVLVWWLSDCHCITRCFVSPSLSLTQSSVGLVTVWLSLYHKMLCQPLPISDTVQCWSGDCLTVTVSQDALSAPPYLWHSPVLVWWLSDCHCITRCFVSPSLSLTQSGVGLVTVTVSQDALSAPPYLWHSPVLVWWLSDCHCITRCFVSPSLSLTQSSVGLVTVWLSLYHKMLCQPLPISDTVQCWSGDCLTVTVSQDALSAPPYLWHSPVLVWWLSDCHCITRCFVSPSLSLTQSSVGLVTVWLSLYHKMLCQPLPISDTVQCWSGDCLTVTVSQDALSAPPYLWHSPVLVWWLSDCHCITRCFVSPSLSLTQSSVGLVTVWLSLYHKMLCQPLPISDTVRCWSGDCLTVTASQDALSAPPCLCCWWPSGWGVQLACSRLGFKW